MMQRIVVELKEKNEQKIGDEFKIRCLQNKTDMRTEIIKFMETYQKNPPKK